VAAAAHLPAGVGAELLQAARAAFGRTLQVTAAICAGVSALTAVLAVVMLRRIRASDGTDAPAE
jgi:DHA2 family multidrug resistance protein-like MFS transporter